MTGGCQCGRIRFSAAVEPDKAYACHCKMCRKATGGAWIAFAGVRKEDVTWEREPDWYASSPIARRPFCSHCGTPLGFAFPDSETMDLTVGAFDDPAAFRPAHNYATESMLDAWTDLTGLPGYRSEENEAVMRRWHDAGMEAPE
ncbi:GFA family protein [Altererythrobacter sp. B11]|uniref:GFA family protein n=1 Tax=Altererythrobacter sp. B11 TaxID=2060312 RepID=UPI000E5B2742|nr:GFA family protein [Altererythrobacter sp. B11]